MNQKDFVDNIQEKFIKCSNCDHYSFDSAHGTTLERIISFFFPSTVYICLNCRKKHIILKNGPSKNTKIILALIPFIIGAYLLIINIDINEILPDSTAGKLPSITKKENTSKIKNKKKENIIVPKPLPDKKQTISESSGEASEEVKKPISKKDTAEKIKPAIIKQPVENPAIDNTEVQSEQSSEVSKNEINGTIILNRRRYGVNWKQIESGIIITKMSPGPFMRGGIKIGDVITTVNGEPAGAGNKLMALRNKVFTGEIATVSIEVIRKGEPMKFIMRGRINSDKK